VAYGHSKKGISIEDVNTACALRKVCSGAKEESGSLFFSTSSHIMQCVMLQ